MELSFISKPKRYENKTVTPVVEEYIDTVDSNLTNSTEFTLLDQNYSDLSNHVSLEDSASRILSQLNNQAIANEFNSNMMSLLNSVFFFHKDSITIRFRILLLLQMPTGVRLILSIEKFKSRLGCLLLKGRENLNFKKQLELNLD